MLELKNTGHNEFDNSGRHYEKDTYSIGDYTIEDVTTTYEDGEKYRHIYVYITNCADRTGERRYIPEIQYDDGCWGKDTPKFKIQTTSYGSLEIGEYKVFLSAQQKAVEVVEILTKELIARQ